MQKKKIILAVAVLLLLGGGVWIWRQYLTSRFHGTYRADWTQRLNNPGVPPIDISDWEIYKNDALGFEIKYPAHLAVEHGVYQDDDEKSTVVTFSVQGAKLLSITVSPLDRINQWTRDHISALDESVILDGQAGSLSYNGKDALALRVQYKSLLYTFYNEALDIHPEGEDRGRDDAVEVMLATFRFYH